MERDLISEVLGYVDDYGSEVDTILPTFNVQNEREEIFDEYMRCLTFIEFMTLNKSNNNLKDEKYGISNIRPKDKISKMLINPETKYYYLLSDYNEITAEEAYVKHIESLKNSCRFLVFELQRENITQEINNREVKNALNVLYKQIKSKSLNEDDRDKLLGDLKKCYQFFVSQCKPKLLKSYEGVLIMAERDTSDSMKSTYPSSIHTLPTQSLPKKIIQKCGMLILNCKLYLLLPHHRCQLSKTLEQKVWWIFLTGEQMLLNPLRWKRCTSNTRKCSKF